MGSAVLEETICQSDYVGTCCIAGVQSKELVFIHCGIWWTAKTLGGHTASV